MSSWPRSHGWPAARLWRWSPAPGWAGCSIAAVTAPWALLADAASFVVAAVAAAGMAGTAPRPRSGSGRGGNLGRGPLAGLGTLARHPLLRAVACEGAIANLCGTMMGTLFVVFAVRELSLGSVAIGVVLAAGGAGALAGAGSAERLGARIAPGRLCLRALAVADLSLLALPVVGGHGTVVVVALASLFAVQGAATAVFEIHTSVLIYASTPADLHGRIQAAMRFVGSFGLIAGAILGGVLGPLLGLRLALAAAAVAGMCHWPVLLRSPFAQASREELPDLRPAAMIGAG